MWLVRGGTRTKLYELIGNLPLTNLTKSQIGAHRLVHTAGWCRLREGGRTLWKKNWEANGAGSGSSCHLLLLFPILALHCPDPQDTLYHKGTPHFQVNTYL